MKRLWKVLAIATFAVHPPFSGLPATSAFDAAQGTTGSGRHESVTRTVDLPKMSPSNLVFDFDRCVRPDKNSIRCYIVVKNEGPEDFGLALRYGASWIGLPDGSRIEASTSELGVDKNRNGFTMARLSAGERVRGVLVFKVPAGTPNTIDGLSSAWGVRRLDVVLPTWLRDPVAFNRIEVVAK